MCHRPTTECQHAQLNLHHHPSIAHDSPRHDRPVRPDTSINDPKRRQTRQHRRLLNVRRASQRSVHGQIVRGIRSRVGMKWRRKRTSRLLVADVWRMEVYPMVVVSSFRGERGGGVVEFRVVGCRFAPFLGFFLLLPVALRQSASLVHCGNRGKETERTHL